MEIDLKKIRVLNTRPIEQAAALRQSIVAANGECIDYPLLTIKECQKWKKNLPALETIELCIFISANAINFFFQHLQYNFISWPDSIQIITLGTASAEVLKKWGKNNCYFPLNSDSEHLLQLPQFAIVDNKPILLIKGQEGRPLIEQALLEKKADLQILEVYRRDRPKINTEFTRSIWRYDRVDIILITSELSLKHLFMNFSEQKARKWLLRKTFLVISKRLAEFAKKLNIINIIICTPGEIIPALNDFVSKD